MLDLLTSDIAIKVVAAITRTDPAITLSEILSSKAINPINIPVMGSKTLRIDVFSPPMIAAPSWKNATATVVTKKANKPHNNQPLNV